MFLLDGYNVPQCLASPDLFDCLGHVDRPPYWWILIGPTRSRTGLHIDPLGTHPWVTLLEGTKQWVLFPYGTDRAMIGMQDPQTPSALWFAEDGGWYHRAMEQVPGAVEILQHRGETVYAPAGWPEASAEPGIFYRHYPKLCHGIPISPEDLSRCPRRRAINVRPMEGKVIQDTVRSDG